MLQWEMTLLGFRQCSGEKMGMYMGCNHQLTHSPWELASRQPKKGHAAWSNNGFYNSILLYNIWIFHQCNYQLPILQLPGHIHIPLFVSHTVATFRNTP